MTRVVAFVAVTSALTLTACDSFGQAMTSHTDVLARAGGHELSVEQVTGMLVPATRLPMQPEVVDAVANLWVDYTLLARAAAEDSSFQSLNLDPIVVPFFNQQLVYQLRDRVVTPDTMITDEELRRLFDQQQPDAEVHARHILFRMPGDASPEARDSVMTRARRVLADARSGADFAQLASQYSEEPGAPQSGGDLGYFGPNQMVQPFEEAAFALSVGEISDLVETPFGYHIIKVEDKRLPEFEPMKDQFRVQVIQDRYSTAEEAYLTELTEGRRLEVQEGAVDIARDLAQKPGTQLNNRQAQRPMVRYTDGSLTAGEYLTLMQQRPPQDRGSVAGASDEQLRDWLRLLARDEILIEEAKRLGIETPAAEQDSARMELRRQLQAAAREAGLFPVAGEGAQASQQQVLALLNGIISGQRNVVQIGSASFLLREAYGSEIFERAIPVVVANVQAQRPPMQEGVQISPPQMEPPPQQQVPPPPTPDN
ncbi:MAG: peptidyl-prolyl cis-trans isomerase [Gemmatimonadetes bacterium]|nr:peptidyl-prolyl cis-trans isomerase [Gemmatimonadota bacterium]